MSPSSLSNTGRPEDEYRARLLEALRGALDNAIVGEWICCEPLDPTHGLCCMGNTVRQGVRELLDDDEDNVVRDQILRALAAVRDEEVEKLRADLADANATLTELAPLSLGARAEKAEAAISAVRKLHRPWNLYDGCSHVLHEDDVPVVDLSEDGETCKTTPSGVVCRECCVDEDGYLTEECQSGHESGCCHPCRTLRALDGEAR